MRSPNSSILYQPSGISSPISYIIFLFIGFIAVPLLAILYSYLIWYIPIIYFNFIVTGVFGVIVGFLVYPIIRYGHVRSKKTEILYGIGLGVFAIYFLWVAHMTLIYNITEGGTLFNSTSFNVSDYIFLLTNPSVMLSSIMELSEYGTWGLGSITFNGFALWAVWIFEAIIIIGAGFVVNKEWSQSPYSERDKKWAEKKELSAKLMLHRGFGKFVTALEQGDINPILDIPIIDKSSVEYTKIIFYDFQNDSEKFMSFFNMTLKRDKEGKVTEDFERVGDYYKITAQQAKELKEKFD